MQLGVWTVLRVGVAVLLLAPIFGCGDCPQMSSCDVRERDCQRSVMEAVACMRGGDADALPKVSVISEAEYLERVEGLQEQDPEARARDEASYRLWNRGLSHFQLAPASYGIEDALQDHASEVGAAYFHEDRSIVIIDRGRSLDSDEALAMLAHEVVHALRDRELDLDAYTEAWVDGYDASLALDALIEGEATHYQLLAALQLADRDPHKVDWHRYYEDWQADTLLDAERDEAPVALGTMRFSYAFGGDLVTRRWLEDGHQGIEDLFADPPHTTSEVMFASDKATLASARQALHEHALPVLPESFETRNTTALGAWIMWVYADQVGLSEGSQRSFGETLGADVMSVQYDEGSDAMVTAWRVRVLDPIRIVTWPPPPEGVGGRLLFDQGELADLVGEPELPVEAPSLAWKAPPPPFDEDDAEAALAAPAWRLPGRVGHRACSVRRPPLPGSDAALDSIDDGGR